MNRISTKVLAGCVIIAITIPWTGCNENEGDPAVELTGNREVFALAAVSDPGVTGTATFSERSDGMVVITLALSGTQAGATHPAHIHANAGTEGGSIALDLMPVDGATGKSETVIGALKDGTAVSYSELVNFNGHVNVHAAQSDLGTLVAQGDIGQNALTGDRREYVLNEVSGSGVSGTAIFAKRRNGKALITLVLEGTSGDGDHPAHIHANDAATGGGIVLDLKNVSGLTGRSLTSANTLKDGTAVSYDELVTYDGHINVHLSPAELGVRVAQGDIGANAP